MSIVHFFESRETATGVREGVPGLLQFRPTRGRVIPGTPDEEVIPAPFARIIGPLDGGLADVPLAETGLTWAWEVSFFPAKGLPGWGPVYVAVTAAPEADWPDLVRVDPTTLEPECTGSGDVLVIDGLTITDNLDGTLTIGA